MTLGDAYTEAANRIVDVELSSTTRINFFEEEDGDESAGG